MRITMFDLLNRIPSGLMALMYFLTAGVWILSSNTIVHTWIADLYSLTEIQIYEELGLVLVTTFLLYFLLRFYRNQVFQRVPGMFEDHPASMLLINPEDGTIVDANAVACTFFGWSRAKLRWMNITQISAQPPQEIRSAIHDAYTQNKNHFVFQHRRLDSSVRVVEVFSGPIKHAGKTHLLAIIHDITEHNRVEQALRENEASLRKSQHVAHVGHWSWETITNTVIWSDEMKRIFGLDPAQFSGNLDEVIMQAVHPEDRPKVIESNKMVLTEQKPTPLEYRIVWPDQSVRDILAIPDELITDDRGNVLKLTGVVQDITARKQLEKENNKLSAQLYQAQKMETIGQLACGIAHDFNNLLMPIVGFAELGMMRLKPGDTLRKHFTQIKETADQATNLTRQLLAFGQKQSLETKIVDLNQVIINFKNMLGRMLPKSIDMRVDLKPQLQPINADQDQLEQVLLNLVVNARDAMPVGGTLTIETDLVLLDEAFTVSHPGAESGLHVLLAVSDTGHGIDAETQQRIFEPFFTTKARGHGTGLGLATVFGIVKQHRGTIVVNSEVNQGTTFKIYLPVMTQQERQIPDKKIVMPNDSPAAANSSASSSAS
jgi:two-component system cell cycle sensor histidine kinase/response regulator CckA